jgi:hypothetical protein
MLGRDVRWAAGMEEFRSSAAPRVLYGGDPAPPGVFHLRSEPLLETLGPEAEVHFRAVQQALRNGAPTGPLSTVFFFLSLWEERRPARTDAHARVLAEDLTAGHQRLDPLVVDRIALRTDQELMRHFPALPASERRFRHVLTVDVDNGLHFSGRPLARALGASARELARGDVRGFAQRWSTRLGLRPDPYAGWPAALAEALPRVDRAIAFVLTRGQGVHDHAAALEHPQYRALLRALPSAVELGLHPSHASGMDAAAVRLERARLAQASGRSVLISRQHFLRMQVPATQRLLLSEGFREDHTLGFHDRTGFRAATCTAFPWYDLEREQATELMCWPFAVMDSALHERMGLDAEQALAEVDRLQQLVRSVQGTFVSVWHDRYLSGYRNFGPWPDVLRKAVQLARA